MVKQKPEQPRALWLVGDRVADQYEIREILGHGGMGVVYRVRHLGWNIDLALKSPLPDLVRGQAARESFIREAETWVTLGLHPHVCTCHYVRTVDGFPRVFAEYLDGGTLREWIGDSRLYQGTAQQVMARLLDIAIQAAWGLMHAHAQGVVHQDVKPANILLDGKGNAKITDFGLARAQGLGTDHSVAGQAGSTLLVTTGGMTPAYASPEQHAHATLGRRSDVWSFAVSMLEMVTGEVTWQIGPAAGAALAAFRAQGFPEPAPGMKVPDALADLLARCLLEDPNERPSMAEVAAGLVELHAVQTGHPFPRPFPESIDLRADELNNRALSLLDLGRNEEAETLLRDARAADPQHPEAIYNSGLLSWRAGAITDDVLVRDLEAAMADSTGPARVDHLLARVHLERGDAGAARPLIEASLNSQIPDIGDLQQAVRDTDRAETEVATGEPDMLDDACVTPDGRHVLRTGSDGTVRVWRASTGRCVRTFTGHTDTVYSVCVTPNGRHVLSAGGDGTVRVWDLSTGRRLRTLIGHTTRKGGGDIKCVYSVCVTPNGHHALSAGVDGTVRMWEVSTGRCLRVLTSGDPAEMPTPFSHLTASVFLVRVTPDGRHAVFSKSGTIWAWELSTGRCLRTLTGHTNSVHGLCVTPDGRYVLSGSSDSTVRMWELATGECVRVFTGHSGIVESVCASPDGRHALSASSDGTVRVWELSTGRCLRTLTTRHRLICMTPDGHQAWLVGDRGMRLWNWLPGGSGALQICRPSTQAELAQATSQVKALVEEAVQATEQSRFPAALSLLTTARSRPGFERAPLVMAAWHRLASHCSRAGIRTARVATILTGHTEAVESVCVTPDGRHVLSAGEDGAVRVWELSTGRCVRTFTHSTEWHTAVASVCVTPDGCWALSASGDGAVRVWELSTGRSLRSLRTVTTYTQSVCVTPDGRLALSAGRDGGVQVWELSTGRCLRTLSGSDFLSVCVTPDGQAVSTGHDEPVRVWELSTGDCVRTLTGHEGLVYEACVTPDGRHVLSAGSDGTVRVWELSTGRCLRTLTAGDTDRTYFTSVCATPDGRYALSAGSDGTVRVWELSTGRCLRTLTGHTGHVTSVRVTPDGRHAVSGGHDGTVRVWNFDWDLEAHESADWHEDARPFLRFFLARRRRRNEILGFLRINRSHQRWSDKEFEELYRQLQYAGYGWLRRAGVRAQLQLMAEER